MVLLLLLPSGCAPFSRAKRCEELKAAFVGLEGSSFSLQKPTDFHKLSEALHQTEQRLMALPPSGADLAPLREELQANLEKLDDAVQAASSSLERRQRAPYHAQSTRARDATAGLQVLARELGQRCR